MAKERSGRCREGRRYAVISGKASIVSGWKNKVQRAMANMTSASVLAEQHRDMAEPGSGQD